MGTRLGLTLLGGFQARLDPGRPVAVPSGKLQALLAYLALSPGQAHPRDKLGAILWSDLPKVQARKNLRQALFELRKALASAGIDTFPLDGEEVTLDPAVIDVDVAAFERGVAEGTLEALGQACTLYRGDLLEGLV